MLLQNSKHCSRQKKKLSSWILNYDKNAYCDNKISENNRDLLIDSFNECSEIRKSFHQELNQFFTRFGFSSMNNIHKYDKYFTYYDPDKYDKNNNSLGNDFSFCLNRYSSMPKIDIERGGIINLKKKLRDNNKSRNKSKSNKKNKKNKNKFVISLKKKILNNENENSKISDSEEEEDEDKKIEDYDNKYSEKEEDNYNNEIEEKIDKEKERDYLLNSIYNQFGITKNQLLNIEEVEEEKTNQIFNKEEGKNKYNKKSYNKEYPINESNLKSKEIQKKGFLSSLNSDKKEKMKEKMSKKIIKNPNNNL